MSEEVPGGPADPESERRRLILDSALDAVVSIDRAGLITDWNRRAEVMFGWSARETLGRPLSDTIIPARFREAHDRGMKRFLATGEGPILNRRIEITARRRDGSEFPVELTVAPASIGGEWMFSSFIRDQSEQKAAQARLFLQSDVASVLAESTTLPEAVAGLLEVVRQRTPWQVAGFWQAAAAEGRAVELTLLDMQAPDGDAFRDFVAASRSLRVSAWQCMPGRAIEEGRPLWFHAREDEAWYLRRREADAAGIRLGLAFPVFIGARAVGALEFFALEDRVPEAELEGALVAVGRQLGQVLERRRAEEELRSREEQLRIVMHSAPALISYIGPDLRYRMVNHTYEAWFGHPMEAIAGRSMEEVLGVEAFARLRPYVDGALEGRESMFEITLPYKTAGTRFVRVHYVPHRRADGSVEGFMVFVMDLTERRDMEEEIRRGEARAREAAERLSLIFDNVNDMIVLLGVEGDGFRILEANDVFLRLARREREGIVGRLASELVPESRHEELLGPAREAVATGRQAVVERKTLSMGKDVIVEARLTPIPGPEGGVAKVLVVAKDITDLRAREGELRQSQKMEAVGRLAGGIAHDFNNLLTAIRGFTELAMQTMDDPEAAKEMLGEVKRGADRAAGLTGQLLAFSRKQILAPKVLDLNAVVTGMETLLRRVIGEDVELETVLAGGLRPARLDPGQLEQIILNLVLNARDAMPSGGRLTLETFGADVSATGPPPGIQRLEARPGPYVVLGVTDTGTGMTPEVREKLFEPFFTTKDPGKGTGMGLATVYGIVKQSGGHIHVYSEPGRGTTFKIYFPAADGEAPPPRKAGTGKVPVAQGRGETLLLVEDEDVVRAYARRVLESLGYKVLLASRGEEALEAAARAEGPIHALVTDVVMPGMSGRDVWERLKPLRPGMRVLFMSGYADTAIVHHGVLDADAPFLAKPFSPAQLAHKVAEVLSAAPAPRPGA